MRLDINERYLKELLIKYEAKLELQETIPNFSALTTNEQEKLINLKIKELKDGKTN